MFKKKCLLPFFLSLLILNVYKLNSINELDKSDSEILPPGVHYFPDENGVLYNDDFEKTNYIWESIGFSGHWQISSLNEVNKVYSQTADSPELNYVINGSNYWNLYEISVKAKSLTPYDISSTDDVLYIFFRYQNSQNYYAITIYNDAKVHLIKFLNGIKMEINLGTIKLPGELFNIKKTYTYIITAWDNIIEFWINGIFIGDWEDPSPIIHGKIGLGSTSCPAAFDDLLIIDLNTEMFTLPVYLSTDNSYYNDIINP